MEQDLNTEIRSIVKLWGADFCGIADLTPAGNFISDQGGDGVANYPFAVSVGIALSHAIVDQMPNRSQRAVSVSYQNQYNVTNQRLDLIANHISSLIQQQGFLAYPIPAAERSDDQRICAVFSHKLAAHLAGLGWIGKNCLLVTPEVGPRARWVSILTDAPLQAAGKPVEDRCGDCRECVDICPVSAFTGKAFKETEPREARYDAGKCARYFMKMREQKPRMDVCGLCLYACPHGRRKGT